MMKHSQAEIVKNLTGKELRFHLYISQFAIILLAIILGFIFMQNIPDSMFQINFRYLAIGAVSGIIVVIIDLLFMKIVAPHYFDDGGINEKIFKGLSIPKIFAMTLLIAVAEELLFRGVIQTKFGLVVASIIFALTHIRYWSKWFLLINIIVLSFWIGFIYDWTEQQLLPSIVMHFTIDFLLGIYISRKSIRNNID